MTHQRYVRVLCLAFFLTFSIFHIAITAANDLGPIDLEDYGLGLDRMDPVLYKSLTREMPVESFHRGHFDWRDQGMVTPAENQRMCGGCWAFAINGAIESQILIEYGYEYDLSDQYILACCEEGAGCCGGSIDLFSFYYDTEPRLEADQPFLEYWSACSDLTCPDECTVNPCDTGGATVGTTITTDSLFTIDITDFNAITNAVFAYGPMTMSFAVHQDFKTYWALNAGSGSWPTGVYTNLTEDYKGGHGVLIIGYDTDDEYLICKNSWGEAGGPFDDGTFKISFSGHVADDVLWGVALAELETAPYTPTPTPTPPPNNDCSGSAIFSVNQCICDDIEGATNSFDCSASYGHNGGDRVYEFVSFVPGAIYNFRGSSAFDADWAISSFCATDSADILCERWEGIMPTLSCQGVYEPYASGRLDFDLQAEETSYFVWIDSAYAETSGEYCIEVECIATVTPTPLPITIYVPDDYSTISDAIDSARSDDTIVLRDGIFSGSQNTNLNFHGKNIILKSEHGPDNTIIDGEDINRGIVFNSGETTDSAVCGITFQNCVAADGAAIACNNAEPIIANCRFISNESTGNGGALNLYNASMWIGGCEFWNNEAGGNGGAAYSEEGAPYFVNCLFKSNFATNVGGALAFDHNGSPYLRNVTTYANSTDNSAGGIVAMWNVDLTIQNSILWYDDPGELLELSGTITVTHSDVYEGWPGTNNIDTNPEFVTGPLGAYYLDQINSPCIDAGARPSNLVWYYQEPGNTVSLDELTTSIDFSLDSNMADMGYHYQTSIPPTPVPTWTPSPTATSSPTATPTFTPSPTPTMTNTPTPVTPAPTNTPASGIIHVPGDFSTIQAAVDAALPGATVIVADGTWTGVGNREIDVDKSITIRSNGDPDTCIIDCQGQGNAFQIHDSLSVRTVIDGFTITNGLSEFYGGAIKVNDTTVTVSNCKLIGNSAQEGAGIAVFNSTIKLMASQVLNNTCVTEFYQRASGLLGLDADVTIENCLFAENYSRLGGAVMISNDVSVLNMRNTTIANNTYSGDGVSGIWLYDMADSTIENCIVFGNEGDQVEFTDVTVTVTYSDIESETLWPGSGNINVDPLFIDGPRGNYYLFDEAAMQSACVGTGSESSNLICYDAMAHVCLDELTTHINGLQDNDTVDMGFHYQPVAQPTYTPPPTPTSSCVRDGDVDSNGSVTAGDAQLVFNFVLGIGTPTTEQECAADCNGDGSMTAADAQQIFFSVLGMGNCVD